MTWRDMTLILYSDGDETGALKEWTSPQHMTLMLDQYTNDHQSTDIIYNISL